MREHQALEHKVDIIKAEQENMKHELAHISGDTKSIKSDMFKEKLSQLKDEMKKRLVERNEVIIKWQNVHFVIKK